MALSCLPQSGDRRLQEGGPHEDAPRRARRADAARRRLAAGPQPATSFRHARFIARQAAGSDPSEVPGRPFLSRDRGRHGYHRQSRRRADPHRAQSYSRTSSTHRRSCLPCRKHRARQLIMTMLNENDPRITAYALGELDAAEAAAVEAALRDQPALVRTIEDIRATARVVEAELASEPALSLTPAQRARIQQPPARQLAAPSQPLIFRSRSLWAGVAIAAAACLAIAAYVSWPDHESPLNGVAKAPRSDRVSETAAAAGELETAEKRHGGFGQAPGGELRRATDALKKEAQTKDK